MKVSIYLDNRNIADVDCSDPIKGNPGVGGTEYCSLLLAQALKIYRPEIYCTLLVEKEGRLPAVDEITVIHSFAEVPEKAEQSDILIVPSLRNGEELSQKFFDSLHTKTIIWGHNFYYSDYCDRIADCNAIKANVFVGRQQYDRYIDHRIIEKSTYIYHMYPSESIKVRASAGSHQVTYIGSIVPSKGFQVLAKAWKDILREVPDAELNIIGSGKLYDRNAALGKYDIAEKNFEDSFMPYLTDESGKILSSVHFLGVMGQEKEDVILSTGVGVVNPTGRTETFGISALDFESRGVPVVTIAKGGFLDTVVDHKTGILIKKTDELAKAVSSLLLDDETNNKYGKNGIRFTKHFSPEKIIPKWDELFEAVLNGKKLKYRKPKNFKNMNLKWLRMINHDVKMKLHIQKGLSVISTETFAKDILKKIRRS